MRIDTHTHPLLLKVSVPNEDDVKFYFNMAKENDLDIVCFTEHLDSVHYDDLLDNIFLKNFLNGEIIRDGILKLPNSLIVSAGAEVSLKGGADVGLHVNPTILKKLNKEKGYYTLDSLVDTVSNFTDEYVIVLHHLFYHAGKWIDNVEEKLALFDAIELPPKDISKKDKYETLSSNFNKPFVSGSDAHTWVQLGVGSTYIDDNNFNLDDFSIPNFKKIIKNKLVSSKISPEAEKLVRISSAYRKHLAS